VTRIDFSGTYDQIGEFVRDLENKFPTAEIQTLSVAGNAGDNGVHAVGLGITLRLQPVEPTPKKVSEKKTT
jgi:hypothetical protein